MIAQMSDLKQVGTQWGIDFLDAAGDIIETLEYTDEAEFDAAFDSLDAADCELWPAAAVTCDTWKRPLYVEIPVTQRRNPITGRFIGGGRGS